ncbi:ABC transporter permease [Collinsella stercoris]|uniref:ABC transporter, permease protein n=1 Tax=Collinsella stercoris DSM 13279 TaxID=445975 RepID=B6GBM4_9ACTN|nr:ABC transporter permease [Collinsella stercoris]EEA90320.1 ABC transporter, permease protein [Collinsella stercoris DSM 13279]UEA46230.1 ABC transporter permease [Collinsella stercoris DSM 13279]UWP11253.1 ABC transporter permease [Collinsella stercoris]
MSVFAYMASHADQLIEATLEHLALLGATMGISCVLAGFVTLACLRRERLADAVVELLGAVYSIPSIALFALLIPLTGLGSTSAVLVMVVYNQFMLVRNALEGLRGVDADLIEAARGMGFSERQVLLDVRLPLALPAIIAGVRLASISTVGIATIAATINAGGMGAILLSGLRSMNMDKILAGTLCSAAIALACDALCRALEARVRTRMPR